MVVSTAIAHGQHAAHCVALATSSGGGDAGAHARDRRSNKAKENCVAGEVFVSVTSSSDEDSNAGESTADSVDSGMPDDQLDLARILRFQLAAYKTPQRTVHGECVQREGHTGHVAGMCSVVGRQ